MDRACKEFLTEKPIGIRPADFRFWILDFRWLTTAFQSPNYGFRSSVSGFRSIRNPHCPHATAIQSLYLLAS
jgi:hypothetical protein